MKVAFQAGVPLRTALPDRRQVAEAFRLPTRPDLEPTFRRTLRVQRNVQQLVVLGIQNPSDGVTMWLDRREDVGVANPVVLGIRGIRWHAAAIAVTNWRYWV